MPLTTIAGKASPTWTRREIRFSPTTGDETIYEFEGPKAGMMPLIQELKTAGFAGNCIEDRSPTAKISYQIPKLDDNGGGDPQPEVPIPIWELFSNAQEIDILESETAVNITEEDRRKIRDGINSPKPEVIPALTGDALTIYRRMLRGVKSRSVDAYTLRQT
ncbi:MAG: hypothetical protein PHQ12_15055, partial [Chthoniobacteraceae bacterium]|nr:hypothetical protein [Chthoniobacteraceae bacterium]